MEFNFLMPVKFIFGENKLQELKELIGKKKSNNRNRCNNAENRYSR
jgi:alcohol dehydrogenase YqhD (iron-dependent ADH family)